MNLFETNLNFFAPNFIQFIPFDMRTVHEYAISMDLF